MNICKEEKKVTINIVQPRIYLLPLRHCSERVEKIGREDCPKAGGKSTYSCAPGLSQAKGESLRRPLNPDIHAHHIN
jgi:hypothetical protein